MKKLLLTTAVALSALSQINPVLGTPNDEVPAKKQYTKQQEDLIKEYKAAEEAAAKKINSMIAERKQLLPIGFQDAWESSANEAAAALRTEHILTPVDRVKEQFSEARNNVQEEYKGKLANALKVFVVPQPGDAEHIRTLKGQYGLAKSTLDHKTVQEMIAIQNEGAKKVCRLLQGKYEAFLASNNVPVVEVAHPEHTILPGVQTVTNVPAGLWTSEIELENFLPSHLAQAEQNNGSTSSSSSYSESGIATKKDPSDLAGFTTPSSSSFISGSEGFKTPSASSLIISTDSGPSVSKILKDAPVVTSQPEVVKDKEPNLLKLFTAPEPLAKKPSVKEQPVIEVSSINESGNFVESTKSAVLPFDPETAKNMPVVDPKVAAFTKQLAELDEKLAQEGEKLKAAAQIDPTQSPITLPGSKSSALGKGKKGSGLTPEQKTPSQFLENKDSSSDSTLNLLGDVFTPEFQAQVSEGLEALAQLVVPEIKILPAEGENTSSVVAPIAKSVAVPAAINEIPEALLTAQITLDTVAKIPGNGEQTPSDEKPDLSSDQKGSDTEASNGGEQPPVNNGGKQAAENNGEEVHLEEKAPQSWGSWFWERARTPWATIALGGAVLAADTIKPYIEASVAMPFGVNAFMLPLLTAAAQPAWNYAFSVAITYDAVQQANKFMAVNPNNVGKGTFSMPWGTVAMWTFDVAKQYGLSTYLPAVPEPVTKLVGSLLGDVAPVSMLGASFLGSWKSVPYAVYSKAAPVIAQYGRKIVSGFDGLRALYQGYKARS